MTGNKENNLWLIGPQLTIYISWCKLINYWPSRRLAHKLEICLVALLNSFCYLTPRILRDRCFRSRGKRKLLGDKAEKVSMGNVKLANTTVFLLSVTSSYVCLFEQEVIFQGRGLAKQAEEMSTRNLRDKRPLQTASKVLTSDLENFGNRVEHVKRWLEDAVNFYNLLNKARDPSSHQSFM